MKFVQSFWSKPFFDERHQNDFRYRHFGGFPNEFLFYACWTYSCLSIKKYYPNLHLITDDEGIKIFKDLLNLPYESFSNDLNDLNRYPRSLWALGKLHSYRIQTEPFCHIDGDVFLFGKAFDSILDFSVFSQSYDTDYRVYETLHKEIHKTFDKVPKEFQATLSEKIKLINAGIIGGKDLDFFKLYTSKAFELIDNNLEKLTQINTGAFNLYFEQFLMSNIANRKEIDLGFLFPNPIIDEQIMARFQSIPRCCKYVHLANTLKKQTIFLEQVVTRLYIEYPEYYNRLIQIYPSF